MVDSMGGLWAALMACYLAAERAERRIGSMARLLAVGMAENSVGRTVVS